MTNICRKISSILFFIFSATLMLAQSVSCKTLIHDLQILQKQIVPDNRTAIFDIELRDTLQPEMIIYGETNLLDGKKQVIRFINNRNIFFIDSIKLLPDAALGDSIWALATLSVSNLREKPDDTSELVSQVTMGTPLKILDRKDKWYRIQTPEYYIGWMEYTGLHRLTLSDLLLWQNSKRLLYNRISGCAVDAPCKKAGVLSDLVLDDIFQFNSKTGNYYKISLPDGRIAYVGKADCIAFEDWSNVSPKVKDVLFTARQMMGFPYLWGGTSSKAVDCSGFVKIAFFSQGIVLARDASQQARYGEAINIADRNNLLPGDLLFFGRSAQQITHVGIYLGNGDFIHASGKVHISSIDPKNPKFVPTRNFVAARRIINSLNTDGIVQVKDHPWY